MSLYIPLDLRQMYLDISVDLHRMIEKYNVLQNPTAQINDFLKQHPALYKTVLVANHIFRAITMVALCQVLPFAVPINIALCFAGSLFYRLTVETNCAYKFALPSFAGSLALPLSYPAVTSLISGVAFTALSAFALAFISLLPVTAYMTYVVLTVNYDVEFG